MVWQHPKTPQEDQFESMLNPLFANFSASETLRINEKARRLEEEGEEIFKFGFGQSPFPIPQLVQERLRENVHRKASSLFKGY